ncbi:MAG: TetR/AcrR family transcriptional regulator [Clostridia bacterium]|nr:TetR/AcrR family transcriptional regulator [Clostridia bacterium]
MAKTDNRVRYTKKVLKDAILEILKEKPVDRVTIKELCEKAEINRGTFYLHYNTPLEVLKEIENDFITEHLAHFSPYMQSSTETGYLQGMFACILDNGDICKILMGKNGDPQMKESLCLAIRDSAVNDWQKEFPEYDREKLEYVFDFVFPGATQTVLGWLENDRGLTVEDLSRRLDRLGHYCHLAIREF